MGAHRSGAQRSCTPYEATTVTVTVTATATAA
jgi:hypothetical protein